MLEILKKIGEGTPHQFKHNVVIPSLPNMGNIKDERLDEWYDISGIRYRLHNKTLIINSDDFFQDSIIQYINSIPNELDITIVLGIITRSNDVAGLNMLFDTLSRLQTNKKILIDLANSPFGMGIKLDVNDLSNNVKITYLLDKRTMQEEKFPGDNSFEYWALNTSDENFKLLLSKLSPLSMARLRRLREIAFSFYSSLPDDIKNCSTIKPKSDYVYEWCCNNISYDFSGTMPDGSFDFDRRDTQDSIHTFESRKGVCAGRARLFKILLNNYYMGVPCFIVNGMTGKLQHAWNEVILENGSIITYDISKQRNLQAFDHSDYELSKLYLDYKLDDYKM